MKLVTATDVWYTQQQKTLDEIAEKLGVVAYRPSYHGAERDKNTVLFYLKEDEEHNREVDRQPVRYSRSEAKDRGVNVNSECVYRDHFWSFENSDANGQLDMGWANNGKLNLRSLDWKTKLEGSITFAFARKMQFNYVRSTGGYLELREADNAYNDWNREQLRALKTVPRQHQFSRRPEKEGCGRQGRHLRGVARSDGLQFRVRLRRTSSR